MDTISAGIVLFLSAVSFSVILTSIVSYLVVERITGLKHLQIISGMQLKAYWIGNFIVDFLKVQLTIFVFIFSFNYYDINLDYAWITYILSPFGIIPFTYVTSFIFTSDSAAQTFTMFLHFLTLAILSTITFALRFTPE